MNESDEMTDDDELPVAHAALVLPVAHAALVTWLVVPFTTEMK
jgi:hypothetical protein